MSRDMYCPICGEPWYEDCIHDQIDADFPDHNDRLSQYKGGGYPDQRQQMYEKLYYNPMKNRFLSEGCVVFGSSHNEGANDQAKFRGQAFAALAELGDMDGAVSEMEDFGF